MYASEVMYAQHFAVLGHQVVPKESHLAAGTLKDGVHENCARMS